MKKLNLLPLFAILMFAGSLFAQQNSGETTITIIKTYVDENGVETVEQTTTTTKDSENNHFYFNSDDNSLQIAELDELELLTEQISEQLEGLEIEFDNETAFIFNDDNVKSYNLSSCNSKPTPFLGVVTKSSDNGVTITQVVKGSAAEAAGLKVGDKITTLAGKSTNRTSELSCAIKKQKIGENVTIKYIRDGQNMQTTATLGTKKSNKTSYRYDSKAHDFAYGRNYNNNNFTYSYNNNYRVDPCKVFIGVYTSSNTHRSGEGLGVNGIIDNTPAQEAGLQQGDVIVAMDGIKVNNHKELLAERNKHNPGDEFTITYKRNGSYYTVGAEFKSCKEETPEEVIEEEAPVETPPVFNNSNNELDIELRAFPNPSNRMLNVRFEGDRVPTTVTITDINGKEVYREHIRHFDGYYNEKIDLREAAAAQGTVVISVSQNGKISSEKILYIQGRA